MPPKKRTAKKQVPGGARKRRGGFPCGDCDFVAKHAMGLGRHRSTRHGVTSKRAQQRRTSGAWLTREEAAARAGVHYNTIRQWENSGRLRALKRPGQRGMVVSARELDHFLFDRSGSGGTAAAANGVDAAALASLERRFQDLVVGLERLIATVKAGPSGSRRGRRPAAASATKAGTRARKRSPQRKAVRRKPARKSGTRKGSARKRTAARARTRRR